MSDPATSAPFTAALLTPAGRGAVATVRVRGGAIPQFRPANGRALSGFAIGRVVFGHWGTDPPEDVVVSRLDADTLDVHCHGGHAAVARILGDLESAGARIVDGWTLTAELEGTFIAECRRALSLTRTACTADIVLEQSSGLLQRAFEELVALGEKARLLMAESGSISGDAARGGARSRAFDAAIAGIDELLRWADFGRHLTQPWRVAIAGRPNVGKSSLMNALVGFSRAIVFDEPGTTRDAVTAETAFDGWPVELIDTAGIRPLFHLNRGGAALEAAGIDRARDVLRTADCRLLLLDVSRPLEEDDRVLLGDLADAIVVAHKSDLPAVWDAGQVSGGRSQGAGVRGQGAGDQSTTHHSPLTTHHSPIEVSSLTGSGLDALQAAIVSRLVPAVPPQHTAIPLTERQIALLRQARDMLERGDDPHERLLSLTRFTDPHNADAGSSR